MSSSGTSTTVDLCLVCPVAIAVPGLRAASDVQSVERLALRVDADVGVVLLRSLR